MAEKYQYQDFKEKQQKLARLIDETSKIIAGLKMEQYAKTLDNLSRKIATDNLKIQVLGTFKNGKSTFINSLLGQEILPAYATPTTAIINEVKYGKEPKAILYFMNPLPEKMHSEIAPKAMEHMKKYHMKDIPPLEIPYDEIEDYVVIPIGMEHKDALKESPFEKVELFWPLDILENGIEIIDSPGLNEHPVRTKVTMEYLKNADAIIFVFTALAICSAKEMEFLNDILKPQGFGDGDIYCIVNRFDNLINDRERERVRNYAAKMLKPYAKEIFCVSAYNALEGKINHSEELYQKSGMAEFEKSILHYLTHERGNIKLAPATRELSRIIRQDTLEKIIPELRSAYDTDIKVLRARYEEAKPRLDEMEKKKLLMENRIKTIIDSMMPDFRRCIVNYYNELPGKIKVWTEEYEPTTELTMMHLSKDAEKLTSEISEFLIQKVDNEQVMWTNTTLQSMITSKVEGMMAAIEGNLQNFFIELDEIKMDISGVDKTKVEQVPLWQRIVAAGGGLLISGYGGAALGSMTGLSKEFAKGLALQVGAYLALAFVGLLNPFTIIAVIIASVVGGGFAARRDITKKVKSSISEEFCNNIMNSSAETVEKFVDTIKEKISGIGETIISSMDNEIHEIKLQVENIIKEMELGKENIEKQKKELDAKEAQLRRISRDLEEFIFLLVGK